MQKKRLLGYLVFFLVFCISGYLIYCQKNILSKQKVASRPDQIVSENQADISDTKLSDSSLLSLDKDELLNKLFPNLSFNDGKAETDIPGMTVTLSLKDSEEGYFVNTKEKNLLLRVELEGMAHAGGLYHAYLGLFDNGGNLLTHPIKFTGSDWNNASTNDGHFWGDEGSFGLYDCKGIKYILSITRECPNGSCCDDSPSLYRINNGKFEEIAGGIGINKTENENPWKVIAQGDKLVIKTVPETSDDDCLQKDFKELKWNEGDCKFE
jgi:hypothetical protein